MAREVLTKEEAQALIAAATKAKSLEGGSVAVKWINGRLTCWVSREVERISVEARRAKVA